jgi:hypothetical protein
LEVLGSGKTSVAQYFALDCYKRGEPCFSNVCLWGTKKLVFEDLMKYKFKEDMEECTFIIDEAGIEFNNRNWEKMSKDIITFFKLHRHFRTQVYIFSQGEDVDITFRRLSQQWYKLEKTSFLLGKFSSLIPVYVSTEIINGKWQIVYEQEDFFLFHKLIPIWKTWKYFNSYDTPDLPVKEYEYWDISEKDNRTLFQIFLDSIHKKLHNIKNFIYKILFFKKKRERIKKNIEDGRYFNND